MLPLYRIQVLIFILNLVSFYSWSQSRTYNYNFDGFKKKNQYFGLTLAYNYSGFKIEHSKRLIGNSSFRFNEGQASSGLTLSMVNNFKIGEFFDFRVLPSVSLSYRRLNYTATNSSVVQSKLIESVFGEIPLLIRFTSAPYRDKRFFLITGVKYAYDFASNSRSDKNRFEIVRISPHDFQVEVGMGMQFYLPYFIFSPELKFSHGIGNLLIYDKKVPESTIIEKLFSKVITFSFHFEG